MADIHFDYKAALACADVGVDKIRINPGNIGDDDRVKAVVNACQQKNIPIRIGVNGGSLEKHILAKYGAPVPEKIQSGLTLAAFALLFALMIFATYNDIVRLVTGAI